MAMANKKLNKAFSEQTKEAVRLNFGTVTGEVSKMDG